MSYISSFLRLIEETKPKNNSGVRSANTRYAMDWDDYHDHDTLNEFIAALADANDFARIINIGQSYEGREMNVLAIEKVSLYDCTNCNTNHQLTRPAPELPTFGWRRAYMLGSG